jgi:hypothetical protein
LLLVAATAAGEEVKPLLDEPNMDPKLKAFGKFAMSLFKVVEAMVENGLVPMANGETTATGGAALSNRSARGPPVPPKAPGVKELRETLEKAERESILFDADLGPNPLGNRSGLAAALSGGIRNSAILIACDRGADPAEAVRTMDDALGCVTEMDFIGIRSEKSKPRPGSTPEQLQQHAEKNYCTMPIKFKFEDRNTRMHFERTIKNVCNLRAVMSLPKPIRDEQTAFVKALRDRYTAIRVRLLPLDRISPLFASSPSTRVTKKRDGRNVVKVFPFLPVSCFRNTHLAKKLSFSLPKCNCVSPLTTPPPCRWRRWMQAARKVSNYRYRFNGKPALIKAVRI